MNTLEDNNGSSTNLQRPAVYHCIKYNEQHSIDLEGQFGCKFRYFMYSTVNTNYTITKQCSPTLLFCLSSNVCPLMCTCNTYSMDPTTQLVLLVPIVILVCTYNPLAYTHCSPVVYVHCSLVCIYSPISLYLQPQ